MDYCDLQHNQPFTLTETQKTRASLTYTRKYHWHATAVIRIPLRGNDLIMILGTINHHLHRLLELFKLLYYSRNNLFLLLCLKFQRWNGLKRIMIFIVMVNNCSPEITFLNRQLIHIVVRSMAFGRILWSITYDLKIHSSIIVVIIHQE